MAPRGAQPPIEALPSSHRPDDAVGLKRSLTQAKDCSNPIYSLDKPHHVEDIVDQDSSNRFSFASSPSSTNRKSTASSIFSLPSLRRTDTNSTAYTRYSIRQSSLESADPTVERKCSLPTPRYCCPLCDAAFDSKEEWKSHKLDHQNDGHQPLTAGPTHLTDPDLGKLVIPVSVMTPDTQEVPQVEAAALGNAWGCGFCAALVQSRIGYLEHVDKHYDNGREWDQWQHSSVIKGLLCQPGLQEAWSSLVKENERLRGTKLRFWWDPADTQRSSVCSSHLQNVLEHFESETSTIGPQAVAQFAFSKALKRTDENITGQIHSLYTQSPLEIKPRGIPATIRKSVSPAVTGDEVSPTSMAPWAIREMMLNRPSAVLPSSSRASSSTPRSFSSRMPAEYFSQDLWGTASQPKVEESKPTPSTALAPLAKVHQREAAQGPEASKPHHRSLRRTDKDRRISGLSSGSSPKTHDRTESTHSRASSAMKLSDSPSVLSTNSFASHNAPARVPLSVALRGLTPMNNHTRNDWLGLVSATQADVSHSRSHSGSTTMTSPTLDDSASDHLSESSLSDMDAPSEFGGSSTAMGLWSRAVQQRADQVMRRIWLQYNVDWDQMITKCVGNEGHTSRGGEYPYPSRFQKPSSSQNAPDKGLRPSGRRPTDDEDDEEEEEGSRLGSSMSKLPSPSSLKKFACPFRKHNPQMFNLRDHEICANRAWSSISRLKEHLYRKHYKIHCNRCKTKFKNNEDLIHHGEMAEGCEIRDDREMPGHISCLQEKQLKSRKQVTPRQSEEEKWRDIYQLLFPNVPIEIIPSPYPEPHEDLARASSENLGYLKFQHHLLSTLPRLFFQTHEEQTGRQIHDAESVSRAVEKALRKAFSEWEALGNIVPPQITLGPLLSSDQGSISPPLPTPNSNIYALTPPNPEYISDNVWLNIPPNTGDIFTVDTPFVSHANDSGFPGNSFAPTAAASSSFNRYAGLDPNVSWTIGNPDLA
ncbi:hypothetical protein B0T17DRAFT_125858 [Bombardia bombarda]|uniref:C2H2-type domain-containing protein n=1 Tax=Bombardia bombarda TaxID=252184 RepID=A0AA39U1W2_9PEZI|nr:hypothetical protein B0T17DRAFT_125858 [Bombardia bombarda]